MYFSRMRIQNYRNFQDVSMTFHPRANYLVGENAIGKSGFLRLLDYLAAVRNVDEVDYADPHRPIRITLELHMLDREKEFFADSPGEHRQTIRLLMEMRVQDICPRLYDLDTGQAMPLETLRRLRYVNFSSFSTEENRMQARVYRELEKKLAQWANRHPEQMNQDTRRYIEHEVHVGNFDSSYYEDIFYLSRILSWEDRHRADNLKFISLAALRIITQVYILSRSMAVPLNHAVVEDGEGGRFLPLVISIDEPEVHLHPYMQRSVLHYFKQLLANEDPRFCGLLQDLFGLSGLRGQLFIVTHSTDSLIDDYRNIVRLYRDKRSVVKAACGTSFHVGNEIRKHLIMHFPEIKEALYARSVLIVEGETEYGCFQLFGRTLDVSFDYYGICLINARGESSIAKIKKLLEYFQIPVAALYDTDVKEAHRKEKGVYFTEGACFEEDLARHLLDMGRRELLDNLIDSACGGAAKVSSDMLRRACRKLNLDVRDFAPGLLRRIKAPEGYLWVPYFAWLYSSKGVILGRIIGRGLQRDEIPPAFARVIAGAAGLAKVR